MSNFLMGKDLGDTLKSVDGKFEVNTESLQALVGKDGKDGKAGKDGWQPPYILEVLKVPVPRAAGNTQDVTFKTKGKTLMHYDASVIATRSGWVVSDDYVDGEHVNAFSVAVNPKKSKLYWLTIGKNLRTKATLHLLLYWAR